MNTNPFKIFWVLLVFFLSGAGNGGDRASGPADGAALYGDCILLCEKLEAAS